jgi:hypothetical protein
MMSAMRLVCLRRRPRSDRDQGKDLVLRAKWKVCGKTPLSLDATHLISKGRKNIPIIACLLDFYWILVLMPNIAFEIRKFLF